MFEFVEMVVGNKFWDFDEMDELNWNYFWL